MEGILRTPLGPRLLTRWRSIVLAVQRGLLALLIFPVRRALLEFVDERIRLVVQAIGKEEEQRDGPARRARQEELAARLLMARQARVESGASRRTRGRM